MYYTIFTNSLWWGSENGITGFTLAKDFLYAEFEYTKKVSNNFWFSFQGIKIYGCTESANLHCILVKFASCKENFLNKRQIQLFMNFQTRIKFVLMPIEFNFIYANAVVIDQMSETHR